MQAPGTGEATAAVGPTARGGGGRPMRADARRNYERIVGAAREVFAREGGGASMEAVAKAAGVGVGTLYRHFPRRIDLVEAVYRDDVEDLLGSAGAAAAELGPWEALVSWIERYVRYAQGKRVFLSELQESFEKNPELKVQLREQINATTVAVLERAQRAGKARPDVTGEDVMALVGPMCMHATLSTEQAGRLTTLVLDGLRATTA